MYELGHLTNKRFGYNQKEWNVDLGSNISKISVVGGSTGVVHSIKRKLILN